MAVGVVRFVILLSLFATCIIAALAGFNSNAYPQDVVMYFSQWAPYGKTSDRKGPPYNWHTATAQAEGVVKGDTENAGAYAGRFFSLADIKQKANTFFPPSGDRIINFSFAGIDMHTCKVVSVDFYADFQMGMGTDNCGKDKKGEYQYMFSNRGIWGHACAMKEYSNDFIFALSIGGWTMSTEFSRCTDTNMDALVNSLQTHIEKYALKIIDIDWEYPGKQGCGGGKDDPCKFVVGRGYQPIEAKLATQSNPASWADGSRNTITPSYFIPIVSSSQGSVTCDKENCEQCHTGDPGVPYRMCKDAKLIADSIEWNGCGHCQPGPNYYSCMVSGGCTNSFMKDCPNLFGQAVTSHDDCRSMASSIFGTPVGASETAQYWSSKGFDKKKDFKNYVKLLKAIKSKYPNMKVTVALGMSDDLIKGDKNPTQAGTSWIDFCTAVDFVNLMTYDFYGNWGAPYHNAPLFDDTSKSGKDGYISTGNLATSVNNLINAGCPVDKMNVGLALYGRTYRNASQKLGEFGPKGSNQNVGVGSYQKGVVSYWDVKSRFLTAADGGDCDTNSDMAAANLPAELKECGKWTLERDVKAGCVPYLQRPAASGTGYDIISYDDPISIGLKAKWARCTGAKGIMFWDAADDIHGELSKSAWEAWNSVTQAQCATILALPTSCEGGGGGGGETIETVTGTPAPPSGDCSDYKACINGCLDEL